MDPEEQVVTEKRGLEEDESDAVADEGERGLKEDDSADHKESIKKKMKISDEVNNFFLRMKSFFS
jgi:hypothetical protein